MAEVLHSVPLDCTSVTNEVAGLHHILSRSHCKAE